MGVLVGEDQERQFARGSGSPRSEKSRTGPYARLGHHTPHPTDFERSSARRGRITLSSAAPHGAGSLDRFRMGYKRKQPSRKVLSAYGAWPQTSERRARKLAEDHERGGP